MSGYPKGSGEQIVCASYPSRTMGGAQQHTSSGLGNLLAQSRCNGRAENGVDINLCASTRSRQRWFWLGQEHSQVIETIDGLGNISRRRLLGQMNTAEHSAILSILEWRMLWWRPGLGQVQEEATLGHQIDEMETLAVVE